MGLLILSLLSTTSCIDNDYDLNKDIDLTITVGGDHFGIPTSSTEEITLKKIFDLDDDSDIKADEVTGDYSLTKDGEGDETNVTVDAVTVTGINVDESSKELEFDKRPVIADGRDEIESEVRDLNSTFNIDKTDVTEDVVSIKTAFVKMPVELKLSFAGENNVKNLYLRKGFKITFPTYLTVSCREQGKGYEIQKYKENGKSKEHILVFTKDQVVTANGFSVPLDITEVDFDALGKIGQGLTTRGEIHIQGDIEVSGFSYMKVDEFPENADVVKLNLITNVDMNTMDITKITGIVDPKIDNITIDNVTIDNLPDFLQDDAVRMDIDNPQIRLTVTNTSPIDVTISGELQPLKKDKTLEPVTFGKDNGKAEVVIPGNATDYVVCLARKEIVGSDIPENTSRPADQTVIIPDLNNLIETIPDEIAFNNITAKAIREEKDIELGQTYNVTTKYVFDAPLAFGENLNIIYKDTLDDWNDDIQDYEFKKAIVKIDAKNGIPLAMHLKATAVDVNKDPIDDITAVVTNDKEIAASPGTNSTIVETKDLEIVLTTKKEGAMKRLDGLVLEVTATTGGVTGVNLNEKTQTLKLDNIRIKIPGGVKVDLN